MRRGRLLAALALAASAAMAAAEGGPGGARCRVMADLRSVDGAELPIYAESLDAAIIRLPMVAAVAHPPPGGDSLAAKAARDGCAAALKVELSIEGDSAVLSWATLLPPRDEVLSEGRAAKPLPDDRALASTFWREAVSALETALSRADVPASEVIFAGAPGTVVSGLGTDIVLPESGEAAVPLVLPARIVWKAKAEGAEEESGSVLVGESGTRIAIPHRALRQDSSWSVEASALGFSFPELGARYDFGKAFFLRGRLSQYFFGLSLSQSGSSSEEIPIFSSYRLLEPGFGLGCLLARRSAAFRPYASLDLFLRLAFIEGERPMLEPVAPFGLGFNLGADWGRSPALRIFLELGFVDYPWADRTLMAASWSGQGMGRVTMEGGGLFPSWPGWFAEFPRPRVGLKARLR